MLKPQWIIPTHYGTFPPLTGTPAQLREELKRQGVDAEVIELEPGGTLN
jgi:L-ascorbate metabolism protein UlaG (beta-lactamase superfamily)